MIQLIQNTHGDFTRKLFLLLAVLLVGVGDAWGWDCEKTIKVDSDAPLAIDGNCFSSGNYKYKDANDVTFTLSKCASPNSGNLSYHNPLVGSKGIKMPSGTYGSTGYNYQFSWSIPQGYRIKVEKVEISTYAYKTWLPEVKCSVSKSLLSGNTGTKITGGLAKDLSCEDKNNGLSSVYFYYYYSKNAGGADTYIYSISVTYTLTHKDPLFNFQATAGTSGSSMGQAFVEFRKLGKNSTHTTIDTTIQKPMGTTDASCDVYYTAKPATDYQFIGWGITSTASAYVNTTQTNYKVTLTKNNHRNSDCLKDTTLYAIFAKFKLTNPNTAPFTGGEDFPVIDFGKVAYNSSPIDSAFTIKAHNIGQYVNLSGLGSVFYASKEGFYNDNRNHSFSVKVRLDPSEASGVFRDTLIISAQRGAPLKVIVKADVDPKPTYTWNENIWNAETRQQIITVFVDTVLTNVVKSNSKGVIAYDTLRVATYGTDNTGRIPISFTGNSVSCTEAGLFKLIVNQTKEPGSGYEVGTDTILLSVIKRTPKVSWRNTTYYFNDTVRNAFSTVKGDSSLYSYSSSDSVAAILTDSMVVTYNGANNCTLTVHSKENYKWESRDFSTPINIEKHSNHVTFDYVRGMFQDNSITPKKEGSTEWPQNEGFIWVKGQNWDLKIDTNYCFIMRFEGIPDKLTFQYRPYSDITGIKSFAEGVGKALHIGALENLKKQYFSVLQSSGPDPDNMSADESDWYWNDVFYADYDDVDNWASASVSLRPQTRYLKFVYSGVPYVRYDGLFNTYLFGGGLFQNIRVTELKKFEADPESINFDTLSVRDGVPEKVLMLTHANAGYEIKISNNHPQWYNVESDTTIRYKECGGDIYNVHRFVVRFLGGAVYDVPNQGEVREYKDTITFTDKLGQIKKVPVVGYRSRKKVPEFTWNPDDIEYYIGTSIPNIFVSSNKKDSISFSFDDSFIDIPNNSNTLYIEDGNAPATISVTVTQEESELWEGRTETYTFKTSERPNLSVPFYVTKTEYDNRKKYPQEGSNAWTTDVNGSKVLRLGSDVIVFDSEWNWDDKYVVFAFQGQPDSIYFDYKICDYGNSLSSILKPTGIDWYVAESEDGENWNQIWEDWKKKDMESYNSVALPLNHKSRYVKLCYSGNYAGFYKDVYVTSYNGIWYLKEKDGNRYLSRGGSNSKMAVVDDYGLAMRKTRKTINNRDYFSRFQYIDNLKFVPNITEASYLLESPKVHAQRMDSIHDSQACEAASEFGVKIESESVLRQKLIEEDYVRDTIIVGSTDNVHVSLNSEAASNGPMYKDTVLLNPEDTGFYKLTFKAFYRMAEHAYAYNTLLNENLDYPVAYLQAIYTSKSIKKTVKTQLCSVYSSYGAEVDDDDYRVVLFSESDKEVRPRFYPTSLEAVKAAFATNGRYENNLYLYLDEPDTIFVDLYSPSNGECENQLSYGEISLYKYSRKTYYFDNYVKNGSWDDKENWRLNENALENRRNADKVPGAVHNVVLEDTVHVAKADSAFSIRFAENNSKSFIRIHPTGSLSVFGGGMEVTPSPKIVVESDTNNAGILRFAPEGVDKQGGTPLAFVQMYSKAYYNRVKDPVTGKYNSDEANWQYLGSPVKKDAEAWTIENTFYGDWLYRWDESYGWRNAKKEQYAPMIPFCGYSLTQMRKPRGETYTHRGRLITSDLDTLLTFTEKREGDHVIANSYTAPIDIRKFEESDFGEALEPTIYLYNTGSQNDIDNLHNTGESISETGGQPGQYSAIPIYSMKFWDGKSSAFTPFIAPMQAFMLKKQKGFVGETSSFVLDYERLVWESKHESESSPNGPMHAPAIRYFQVHNDTSGLAIRVLSDKQSDVVYLMESHDFAHGFDNGYDATKSIGTVSLSLYALEDSLRMAVDATPEFKGTYLGFHSEKDSVYSFRFNYVDTKDQLYLLDLETARAVPIMHDTTWTFHAEQDSAYAVRFRIVDETMLPDGWDRTEDEKITTDIEHLNSENVDLWQAGHLVYATCVGKHTYRLYDAKGQLVVEAPFVGSYCYDLSGLPIGVYVAKVENKVLKVVNK